MRHCSPPDADKLRRFHWLLTNITGSSVFIAYDCRYDCVVSFYKVFNEPAYLGDNLIDRCATPCEHASPTLVFNFDDPGLY